MTLRLASKKRTTFMLLKISERRSSNTRSPSFSGSLMTIGPI